MYYVTNNVIYLTRGDSMTLTVSITDSDGNEYTPSSSDVIRFALKRDKYTLGGRDFSDTAPLITKTIDPTTLELVIDPEDTADLDFGQYAYDIELTDSDGAVDTFIPPTKFYLCPEVY